MTARMEFVDVSLTLEGRQVFGPVSVQLRERRIGVVGQNGAGKSSFLRLLSGLAEPTTGAVFLDGKDIAKDRRVVLTGIGVIFQNPDHQILFPTVLEELAFGVQQLGATLAEAQEKAMTILKVHNRSDWADRGCHTLSQGQRHFLCLMSVLAMAPDVVVLDEPYAGLDIPTSMHLHRELDLLPQSIVMITHDPKVLVNYDRVLWLDDGKVVLDGLPNHVLPEFEVEMQRRGAC